MKTLNSFIATLIFLSFVSTAKTQQAYVGVIGGLNFTDLDLVAASGANRLTAPRTVMGLGGILASCIASGYYKAGSASFSGGGRSMMGMRVMGEVLERKVSRDAKGAKQAKLERKSSLRPLRSLRLCVYLLILQSFYVLGDQILSSTSSSTSLLPK